METVHMVKITGSGTPRVAFDSTRGIRFEPDVLQAASKTAGSAPVHSLGWLRNQAATAAVEAGQGIDVASRALGHSDPSTTRRHYDRAKLIDARRRFAEARESEIGAKR